MDVKEYKLYHEKHMMFNNGISAEECGIILSIIPFLVFFSLWISSYVLPIVIPIFEFCIIILPVILIVTVFSEIIQIILTIFILLFIVICAKYFKKKDLKKMFKKKIGDGEKFITNYRACTIFISSICILAVDFNIFPKKFAKTETFGFSLMDLGVGFFICSNGLVEKWELTKNQRFLKGFKVFKTVIILFTLGIIRLLVIKAIGYQEHVTEYGTHWNFFFTLGFCKIFVFCIKSIMSEINPFQIFLITGLIHEMCLNLGLKEWVLSDLPRTSFLVANKEGFTSCLGYVSLYFGANSIQKFIVFSKNKTYEELLTELYGFVWLFWGGTYFCFQTIGISRRLANFGYIIWVISLSLHVVGLFLIGELTITRIKQKEKIIGFDVVPQIFQSINSNGLFFFLLSNLLTGLINCIFQTLLLGNFLSLIIIIVYMVTLCYATHNLHINIIYSNSTNSTNFNKSNYKKKKNKIKYFILE